MIKRADSAFLVSSEAPAAIGMTLAAIGRDRPVVYDEFMAAPLVLRHQDVSRALRDGATFSTEFYGGQPDGGGDGRAQRRGARSAADLETQRRTKEAELKDLRGIAEREQPQQPELLDLLPQLSLKLPDAPVPIQRSLYEACGLKIYYDHTNRHVTIHATLRADTVPAIAQATIALAHTSANAEPQAQVAAHERPGDDIAHALHVLPTARTCDRKHCL